MGAAVLIGTLLSLAGAVDARRSLLQEMPYETVINITTGKAIGSGETPLTSWFGELEEPLTMREEVMDFMEEAEVQAEEASRTLPPLNATVEVDMAPSNRTINLLAATDEFHEALAERDMMRALNIYLGRLGVHDRLKTSLYDPSVASLRGALREGQEFFEGFRSLYGAFYIDNFVRDIAFESHLGEAQLGDSNDDFKAAALFANSICALTSDAAGHIEAANASLQAGNTSDALSDFLDAAALVYGRNATSPMVVHHLIRDAEFDTSSGEMFVQSVANLFSLFAGGHECCEGFFSFIFAFIPFPSLACRG